MTYYYGFLPADPSPAGPRNSGLRWHTAMEGYYGYGLGLTAVLDHLYKADIERYPDFEPQLRKDWELAKIMAEGYLEWAAAEGVDANLAVMATEAEVRVPLPGLEGTADLRAKMDQIVLNTQTGLYSFRDWKTADSFKRHEIIEMDPQMRLYSLIQWLASGQPPPLIGRPAELRRGVPQVMGGIVNTARRVKRTGNSQPPYYDQHGFRFGPEQLAATLASTQQVATEILHARQVLDSQHGEWRDAAMAVQEAQLTACRPVKILHDCSWSCPLAGGLCPMMDDGTGWMRALTESGRYVQGDPYTYYDRPSAAALVPQLAAAR